MGAKLSKELNAEISEEVILLALADLKKRNLLQENESSVYLSGISRRDVVKRVGMSSMVALPVIASVVAPKAVNAQSSACVAPETPCAAGCCDVQPGIRDCCGGICTDLSTPSNCGFCGNTCAGFEFCNFGVCDPI